MKSQTFNRLAHALKVYFDLVQTESSSDLDNAILSEGRAVMKQHHSQYRVAQYGRKRKVLKIAAVLGFVLVVTALLLPERRGLLTDNVAFADIQKTLYAQETVRMQGTRVCTFPATENRDAQTRVLRFEKIASALGHMDNTYDANDTLVLQVCVHFSSRTVTVLLNRFRQCYRLPIFAETAERLQNLTLEDKMELLFFAAGYRDIKPKVIQGVQAMGYETDHVAEGLTQGLGLTFLPKLLAADQGTVQMWVHPDTHLPLQVQVDIDLSPCLLTGLRPMHLSETSDRFEWGFPVEENDYQPTIPDGYQVLAIPASFQDTGGVQ